MAALASSCSVPMQPWVTASRILFLVLLLHLSAIRLVAAMQERGFLMREHFIAESTRIAQRSVKRGQNLIFSLCYDCVWADGKTYPTRGKQTQNRTVVRPTLTESSMLNLRGGCDSVIAQATNGSGLKAQRVRFGLDILADI